MRRLAQSLVRSLALAAAVPSLAAAQVWGVDATGNPTFTTDYVVSGTWFCGMSGVAPGTLPDEVLYGPGGGCAANGNQVTITHGTASLTATFNGFSGPITSFARRTPPVSIGTLTSVVGGVGPFTFPDPTQFEDAPRVYLNLLIARPGLPGGPGGVRIGYLLAGGTLTPWGANPAYREFGTINPNGRHGSVIFGEFSGWALDATRQGPQSVYAVTSLIPEPSTWALFGTGLLALGAVARRRRVRA